MESEIWQRIRARRVSRRNALRGGALAGMGVAGMAVVGCGGSSSSSTPTPSAAPATSPASTASGASPSASATAQAPRGTVNMALVTLGDQSGDPHNQNAGNNLPIINSCFEQFSRVDVSGKLVPALATSIEESPDHLTFTVKLRPDATFWDGTKVTSDDAVWSYQRWVGMTPPDSYAGSAAKVIDHVEAPDAGTVVVKMKTPSTLRMRWAGSFAPQGWNIASHAYYNKVGDSQFAKIPMATGPYKLVSNTPQASVDLEAYANHYALHPLVQKIHMDLVPEQATRIARLQTGEAGFVDGVLGPALPPLEGDNTYKIYEAKATANCNVYFHSPDQAPYNDVRFRQALALLIDQNTIVKSLFLGHGQPSPAVHIFPTSDAWDPSIIPLQAYDPKKAADLLGQAGLANGVKLKIWSYDSSSAPLIPDSVVAVTNMWRSAKIDAQIQPLEANAYFTKYRAKQLGDLAPLASGATDLAEGLLDTFYLSSSPYGVPLPQDINTQITALSQEFDENAHKQKAQAIFKTLSDNQWSMSFPFGNSVWATRKDKISNWTPITGTGYPSAFYTIAPA